MTTPLLNLRRSLFDTYGYRHTLVHATPVQLLTRLEGMYWLWDRETGACLMGGLHGESLTNTRPPDADLRAQGDSVAETRAFLLARETIEQACVPPGRREPASMPEAVAEGEDRTPAREAADGDMSLADAERASIAGEAGAALAASEAAIEARPAARSAGLGAVALVATALACLLPVGRRVID